MYIWTCHLLLSLGFLSFFCRLCILNRRQVSISNYSACDWLGVEVKFEVMECLGYGLAYAILYFLIMKDGLYLLIGTKLELLLG